MNSVLGQTEVHVFEAGCDMLSYACLLYEAGYDFRKCNLIALSGISGSGAEGKIPMGMAEYLEMAAQTGVRNTSFISLIPANDYCIEQFVHPDSLHLEKDERFRIWNRFHDHDFCSCSSGDYKAASGWVRFYYRAPGRAAVPYARQLVYTADNRLLAGFGGPSIDLNPA